LVEKKWSTELKRIGAGYGGMPGIPAARRRSRRIAIQG
jgi:hypothetical protein